MSQANLAAALRAFFMGSADAKRKLYNRKIDLASGKDGAPDEVCTNSYPVKVENGGVFLGLLKQEEVA